MSKGEREREPIDRFQRDKEEGNEGSEGMEIGILGTQYLRRHFHPRVQLLFCLSLCYFPFHFKIKK